MAWRIAGRMLGALVLVILAWPAAAETALAVAAGPIRIGAAPIRIAFDRLSAGPPTTLVLTGVKGRRGGTYNVFLADPPSNARPRSAGDPGYIGTFGLFDTGPEGTVSLAIPPRVRAELDRAAPAIEIVPMGRGNHPIAIEGLALHNH